MRRAIVMVSGTREPADHIDQHQIEEGDVAADDQHGDDHHDRGVGEFLEPTKPLFFGVPRPSALAELGADFGGEGLDLAEHAGTAADGAKWRAGQEGLEPPTYGFGIRRSTN